MSYDQFDASDNIDGLGYQSEQLMDQGGAEFQQDQALYTGQTGNTTTATEQTSTDASGNQQSIQYGQNGEPIGYTNADGGYQNYFNSDGTAAVTTNDYDPGAWEQTKSFLSNIFKSTPDANGRQQQSFAASIVLGAAQSVLKSMSDSKAQKAASDLANQNSSNRIKEKSDEENRLRAAASAMPTQTSRTRTVAKPVGLLSQAR